MLSKNSNRGWKAIELGIQRPDQQSLVAFRQTLRKGWLYRSAWNNRKGRPSSWSKLGTSQPRCLSWYSSLSLKQPLRKPPFIIRLNQVGLQESAVADKSEHAVINLFVGQCIQRSPSSHLQRLVSTNHQGAYPAKIETRKRLCLNWAVLRWTSLIETDYRH